MAVEAMDSSSSSKDTAASASTSTPSSSASRIVAAANRLSAITSHADSIQSASCSRDCNIAFSEPYGLVAYPVKTAETPIAIAVKPLLAASSSAQPLLLYPPLLPLIGAAAANTSYRVRHLAFSPSASSIAAVIQPRGHHRSDGASSSSSPVPYGLVCIWSRHPRKSALNAEWTLAGQWPLLESGSQLGPDVVALQWLREEGNQVLVEAPKVKSEADKVAPPTTQLPGMSSHDKQSTKRFKTTSVPSPGPTLVARGSARPEALFLVGSNGVAHFLHRHTSIASRPLASTQGFELISAPLRLPATVSPSTMVDSALHSLSEPLSHCAIHAVAGCNSYLVAFKEIHSDSLHLTDVVIDAKRDDPVMQTKPLQSISLDGGLLTHLAFSSSLRGKGFHSESVWLLGSFAQHDNTLIKSWSLAQRRDVSGKGSLSEAFGELESRKKSLSEIEGGEVEEWHLTLHAELLDEGKTLHQLVAQPKTLEQDEVKGLLAATLTAQSAKGQVQHGLAIIDPARLAEQGLQSSYALPPREASLPLHTVVPCLNAWLAGWVETSTLTPHVASWRKLQDDAAQDLPAAAAAILQAIMRRSSYLDVLMQKASTLRQRESRAKLLELVGGAFGLDRAGLASSKAALLGSLNLKALCEILTLQVAMARVAAASSKAKSVVAEQCREEVASARRQLALLQSLRAFSVARQGADSWKPLSVVSLAALAANLVQDVESVCQHAVLLQGQKADSGHGDDAGNSPLASSSSASSLFSTLSHSQHSPSSRLTLELLIRNLRLLLSLLSWLDKVCADGAEELRSSLVATESARLINEVKAVKMARRVARMDDEEMLAGNGNGAARGSRGNGNGGSGNGALAAASGATPAALMGTTPLPSLLVPGATGSSPLFTGAGGVAGIGATPPSSSPAQRPPLGAKTLLTLSHRPAAALTRRLAVLRDALRERLRVGTEAAIDLDVFVKRLEAWMSSDGSGEGATSAAGSDGGLAHSLVYGSTSNGSQETATLARHLLSSDADGASVLGERGRLSLFLDADDFVWSLEDVAGTENGDDEEKGAESAWAASLCGHGGVDGNDEDEEEGCDALTGIQHHSSRSESKKRRRLAPPPSPSSRLSVHLLTGERTRLQGRDATMALAMETLSAGGVENPVEEDEEALRAVLEGDCDGDDVARVWDQRVGDGQGWWLCE